MAIWATVFYAAWSWGNYLNAAAFSRDRIFHTLAFLNGTVRPTEPLWSIIAPVLGTVFKYESFEAASLITLVMIAVGLRLHRVPIGTFLVLIFSPGVAYFLTNALRQGFALGVFLVLLGLWQRKNTAGVVVPFRWWWVVVAAAPAALIHNSIAIGGVYVLASMWLAVNSVAGRRSQQLQACLLAGSAAMMSYSLQIGGTASALLLVQASLLVGSFIFRPLRGAQAPLFAVYLAVCASGFMFTTTGLRVVIMVSLLALLVVPRYGKFLAIFGCVLYPVFQYGGFAIEYDDGAHSLDGGQ